MCIDSRMKCLVQTILYLSDTFKTIRKDIKKCILIREPSRRKGRKKMRSAKNIKPPYLHYSIPICTSLYSQGSKKMEERAPRKMFFFLGSTSIYPELRLILQN